MGVVDDPHRLAHARQTLDVVSAAGGYIAAIQCEQLGVAGLVLGGGREKKEDKIDPAVGLEFHKRIGDAVERGEPLCTLHYNSDTRLCRSAQARRNRLSHRARKTEIPPTSHLSSDQRIRNLKIPNTVRTSASVRVPHPL